jgi:hypothetical protein
MTWIVEVLDARVRDELEDLPADMRARFRRIVELIQGHGLKRIREPSCAAQNAFMRSDHHYTSSSRGDVDCPGNTIFAFHAHFPQRAFKMLYTSGRRW